MIEVSATKAYSVQGIRINGQNMVSIRQMYRTKNDPQWKPGRQGAVIPVESVVDVFASIREVIENNEYLEVKYD